MARKVSFKMSSTLIQGCQRLSLKAFNDGEIALFYINLAIYIFGYSCIEVTCNELVSLYEVEKNLKIPSDYLLTLKKIEQKLTIRDKFNLLVGLLNQEVWDNSKEPFQSFNIIQTIRNEIIHYKGDFDETGKLPIKKLMPLFTILGLNSAPERSWPRELFNCREFGIWVYDKVQQMNNLITERIYKNLFL